MVITIHAPILPTGRRGIVTYGRFDTIFLKSAFWTKNTHLSQCLQAFHHFLKKVFFEPPQKTFFNGSGNWRFNSFIIDGLLHPELLIKASGACMALEAYAPAVYQYSVQTTEGKIQQDDQITASNYPGRFRAGMQALIAAQQISLSGTNK
jgi:hypothetical protein